MAYSRPSAICRAFSSCLLPNWKLVFVLKIYFEYKSKISNAQRYTWQAHFYVGAREAQGNCTGKIAWLDAQGSSLSHLFVFPVSKDLLLQNALQIGKSTLAGGSWREEFQRVLISPKSLQLAQCVPAEDLPLNGAFTELLILEVPFDHGLIHFHRCPQKGGQLFYVITWGVLSYRPQKSKLRFCAGSSAGRVWEVLAVGLCW